MEQKQKHDFSSLTFKNSTKENFQFYNRNNFNLFIPLKAKGNTFNLGSLR